MKILKADNDFLIAIMNKLSEIMENTTDIDTESELAEFISIIADSLR